MQHVVENTKMVRVSSVCRRLDMTRTTIMKLIKEGKLRASKPGGHWRIDAASVDELLKHSAAMQKGAAQ